MTNKIWSIILLEIYRLAGSSRLVFFWTYIIYNFIKEDGTPACSTGGYPLIRQGSRGAYVCIAQDDLNTLGYTTGGLDGVFGPQTYRAVLAYQRSVGLAADGIIGCNTWRSLQESVVGTGRTSTTINS